MATINSEILEPIASIIHLAAEDEIYFSFIVPSKTVYVKASRAFVANMAWKEVFSPVGEQGQKQKVFLHCYV